MSSVDPVPGQDYIAVVGAGKTGTTGVYSTIKHSAARAGHRYAAIFEPSRIEQLDAPFIYPPAEPLLVKIMIDRVPEVLPDPLVFERRVMTVRDPRDVLISTLLFRPLTRASLARVSDEAIERFIAALARKERDPGCLSVGQLFNLAYRLGIGGHPYQVMVDRYAAQRRLTTQFDFHTLRYEDFVSGNLGDLSDYLGFENVTPSTALRRSSTYGHISRSKEGGQFRHWFREDDLERFNKTFADALSTFGYDVDVPLADVPRLDPAAGSQYLRERYRQRRSALRTIAGAREMSNTGHTSETVADLSDHGEDGDAWACLRVAQAYRSGNGVEPDEDAARLWARRAARLGLAEGMQLAAELLSGRRLPSANDHRERRVWEASGERIQALERDLAALKGSVRMQVGTQIVRAVGNPRGEAVPAVRKLLRLWHERRAGGRAQVASERSSQGDARETLPVAPSIDVHANGTDAGEQHHRTLP